MFRYPGVQVHLCLNSGMHFPLWLLKPCQRRGDFGDNGKTFPLSAYLHTCISNSGTPVPLFLLSFISQRVFAYPDKGGRTSSLETATKKAYAYEVAFAFAIAQVPLIC
jgi:hypothetical protein